MKNLRGPVRRDGAIEFKIDKVKHAQWIVTSKKGLSKTPNLCNNNCEGTAVCYHPVPMTQTIITTNGYLACALFI